MYAVARADLGNGAIDKEVVEKVRQVFMNPKYPTMIPPPNELLYALICFNITRLTTMLN